MARTPETQSSPDIPAGLPATMTAVVADRYGDGSVVTQRVVPLPSVGPADVLIEVRASGVDRGVLHLLNGLPYLIRILGFGFRRPKQPICGSEVSGVVVHVGPEVTRFEPGQRVFGEGSGAFAPYTAIAEDKLSLLPDGVSFELGATSAISGVTALQALTDVGNVRPGQSVLVIGASGGVGSIATQLAVHFGARVTGVASGKKADAVRALGAHTVLDYSKDAYLGTSDTYDLIIDAGGLNSIRSLQDTLNPGGTLVIVGGEGGSRLTGGVERNLRASFLSLFTSKKLTSLISKGHYSQTDRIGALLHQGAITPLISHRFPLSQARDAIECLAGGHVTGKVVLLAEHSQ